MSGDPVLFANSAGGVDLGPAVRVLLSPIEVAISCEGDHGEYHAGDEGRHGPASAQEDDDDPEGRKSEQKLRTEETAFFEQPRGVKAGDGDDTPGREREAGRLTTGINDSRGGGA